MADLGDTVRIRAGFTAAGEGTDPTTVTLTITKPDGTTITPSPIAEGDGLYHYDLLVDQLGLWTYTYTGTGVVPATETGEILVVDETHDGPDTGPCEYWLAWTDLDCDAATLIDDVATQNLILGYVSETLYALSCSQFGFCQITARPCRNGTGWAWWPPYTGATGYLPFSPNRGCRGCHSNTSIVLPGEPVARVDQVTIDGDVLDPTAYRVDEWKELVRLDGLRWPASQNLALDDGDPGTWSVTWTYGRPIPAAGVVAARLYACELAKSFVGQECALPQGTTSVSRDGVSINIIDSSEAAASGQTGILLVDLWLHSVCPNGQTGALDIGAATRTVRTGT